jgi:hypothetical protein
VSPFLHFRAWLRSGPVAERVLTAFTGVAVLSLVVWASAPQTGGQRTESLVGPDASIGTGPAPQTTGAPVASGSTGAAVTGTGGTTTGVLGGTAGGSTGGSTGSGATTGGSATSGSTGTAATTGATSTTGSAGGSSTKSCGTPGATDVGVTATTITIGVVIVDLGAANNLLAVPTAANQKKAHQAVFDDINRHGGVLCRKLVAKFYTDGVLDTSQEHAQCLQMQQDKLFVVFNNLFNTTEQTCIAKARIPNIWYTPPHTPDVKKYSPYILSWQPDFDRLIHQYVAGAKAQGYFKGMKKLGILKQTCYPDEIVALNRELTLAGVDPSKATVFDEGCSSSPVPDSSTDTQAVLTFQKAGVTHLLNVAYANDASLSKAADNQRYYPKFAHMEDASATAIESGSQKPGKSFGGALLISTIQTGAANTAGYRFNQPTKDCTRLLAGAGLTSAYSGGTNALYGIACLDGSLFKGMAEHATALKRTALAAGLSRLGPLDLPYPGGPINVASAAVPTGGQLARPGVWVTACNCWRVTDARFRAYTS